MGMYYQPKKPMYKKRGRKPFVAKYRKKRYGGYNPFKKIRNRIHFAQFRIQDEQVSADIYNQVTASNPVTNYNHMSWALDQFPQHGCYTRMYNQYKISKIKVEFIPINTRVQLTSGIGANSNVPTFSTFINRTSTTYPVNLNQVLSVPGAKQVNCGRYMTQYFTPVTFDTVYRPLPATTNALNPEYNQWLRTSETDVRHHGVSWVVSESGSEWAERAFAYRVVVTIYAQFKGIKADTTV